jgi:hypothetical protein
MADSKSPILVPGFGSIAPQAEREKGILQDE